MTVRILNSYLRCKTADRIGIMIKGRLVKLGTLEELENATGKKGLEEVFVAVAEGEEI